jgi:hypothetical protein
MFASAKFAIGQRVPLRKWLEASRESARGVQARLRRLTGARRCFRQRIAQCRVFIPATDQFFTRTRGVVTLKRGASIRRL